MVDINDFPCVIEGKTKGSLKKVLVHSHPLLLASSIFLREEVGCEEKQPV